MRLPALTRLGTKVNLSLLVFLILLGAATATLLFVGFRTTQGNAEDVSRQGLEDQGRESLMQLAGANSTIGQMLTSQAVLMGANASRYMIDLKATGAAPAVDAQRLAQNDAGYTLDPDPNRRTDILVPPRVLVDERVLRDLRDSAGLDAIFPALLANNPDAAAIYYIGDSGLTRYYPAVGLQSRVRDGLPDIDGDVRSQLGPAANPDAGPVWTAPYRDEGGQGLVVTTYTPVYEGGEYRGVIGVDLSLARLLARADQTKITPGSYAFVIDRNGELLPSEAIDIVQAEAGNRGNREFARTLAAMRNGEIGVDRVRIADEEMFVGYAPLGDFGGSLALAVPIDELTAQAEAVTSSIDEQGDETIIFMLGMMAVFFIGALLVSAWLGRRVVLRPIERLVMATRSVAAGDLDAKIPVQSEDELGMLADSFNFMTSELASSRQRLEDRNVLLEDEITERRRVEAQVREERDFNEAIVGSGGALIIVMDPEGRIVRFNEGCERSSGYTFDEVVGKPAWAVLSPEDERRGIAELFARIAESEFPNHNDSHWHTKDGRRRYISWSNSVIRDGAGTPRYYVSTGIDRTEQRQSEDALREREQQYRDVFESTTDGMFITDLQDRIVDANPAAQSMHGYTLEELRALEPFALLHPRSREMAQQYLDTVGGGGEFHTRARSVRKDGSSFISEVMGAPITYQGAPHILAVTRDISEQVGAERLLREREEQYRSVYENATDALIITSFDGRVVDVNPAGAAMHGYTRDEFVTLHPTQFIHPDDHHLFEAYIQTVSEGRDYRARARDVRKDGSAFHVEVLGTQIIYQGTPHVLGVVRDITAQVLTEQVLEQRVDERTRELSTLLDVSHNVASTLELQPLLRLILDQMRSVVGYDSAGLLMLEGDELAVLEVVEPGRPGGVPRAAGARFGTGEQNSLWRRLSLGETLIINDVRGESAQANSWRRQVAPAIDPDFSRVRAWMAVPLALKDRVIGLLALSRETRTVFTEQDAQLATAIATQAAVAIENARLYEEAENRTRELKTLLGVSQNVASTLELRPLLRLILEQLRTVVRFERASILMVERGALEVLEVLNIVGTPLPNQVGMRFDLRATDPFREQMGNQQCIIVNDPLGDSPQSRQFRAVIAPAIDPGLERTSAWMAVPITLKDRVVGMLALTREYEGDYTERDSQLALVIAAQAAVAIENARLFEQAEERTNELGALLEISKGVNSTLELRSLLSTVLDEMSTVAEYNRASILLRDGDELVVLDSRSRPRAAGDEPVGMRMPLSLAAPLWALNEQHQAVFIDNVRDENDPLAAAYRTLAGAALATAFRDVRSWLSVPLALKDRVIGAMTLSKNEPAYYTERHARLAATVANQAAIAIENARLYEEAEHRTGELAALLDVSQSVASTLELSPLVGQLLDRMRSLIEYDGAALLRLEGNELHMVAGRRPGYDTGDDVGFLSIPVERTGAMWDLVSRGLPAIVEDARSDEPLAGDYRNIVGDALDTAFADIRAYLAVPLMLQGRITGVLSLSHHTRGFFREEHARLARAVADQAAIGIENARLFEHAEERTNELGALLDVSHSVASTLELKPMVGMLLDRMQALIDYDGASVLTLESDALRMLDSRRPGYGSNEADIAALTIPVQRTGSIWQLLRRNEPVSIPDVTADDALAIDYRSMIAYAIDTTFAGVRSWLAVPLAVKERTIGTLTLSHKTPGHFKEEHLRLARAIADQAAVAIDNARLYGRAQELAAVEERQRLARELHDSVSQALYGIGLGARTARTLLDRDPERAKDPVEYVMSLAEAGLAEMRALIFELRPESLELEGLVAALDKQAAAMRARHNVRVDTVLCDEPDIPLEVKQTVSRIAQEALHNIVKHARATSVNLMLECTDDEVTFEIRDDGSGFDPVGDFAGHLGLRSMRERAANLGGRVDIESAPGAGAKIRVTIPINR